MCLGVSRHAACRHVLVRGVQDQSTLLRTVQCSPRRSSMVSVQYLTPTYCRFASGVLTINRELVPSCTVVLFHPVTALQRLSIVVVKTLRDIVILGKECIVYSSIKSQREREKSERERERDDF